MLLVLYKVHTKVQRSSDSTKVIQKYQKVLSEMSVLIEKSMNSLLDIYFWRNFVPSDVKVQSTSESTKLIQKYCLYSAESTAYESCTFKLQWLFCSHISVPRHSQLNSSHFSCILPSSLEGPSVTMQVHCNVTGRIQCRNISE